MTKKDENTNKIFCLPCKSWLDIGLMRRKVKIVQSYFELDSIEFQIKCTTMAYTE